ncbi:hypothetical protein OSTOST_24673 [Ostertagia ostertagi]
MKLLALFALFCIEYSAAGHCKAFGRGEGKLKISLKGCCIISTTTSHNTMRRTTPLSLITMDIHTATNGQSSWLFVTHRRKGLLVPSAVT